VSSFPATGKDDGFGGSYAMHIGLSPDGHWLATSSVTGRGVNIWDTASGQLVVPLPEEKHVVWCLAWNPDGRHLAVSRSNGALAVWDLASVRRQLSELGMEW
jgi:WD40 repeat protein